MTPRKHSLMARRLIKACGGLSEAAAASRLNVSSLGNFQNANMDAFMPADVIHDLETYCGDPLYSQGLLDACADLKGSGDLVGEGIDLVARAATLSSHIHHAMSDHEISPAEADKLYEIIEDAKRALARTEADITAALAKLRSPS